MSVACQAQGGMNVPVAARLLKTQPVTQLKGALRKLMDRHPSLRTAYKPNQAGVPMQKVIRWEVGF
jgi:hypothetical protein